DSHGGPSAALPSGGSLPQGAGAARRPRRSLLRDLAAAQPGQGAPRRERALELRAARPVRDPPPPRHGADRRGGSRPRPPSARGSAFLQPGVEDVVFLSLRFPQGRMAHVQVSWLDPHKIRKFTVVGSRKMAVFDDMEASEKIRIYDKGVDRGGEIVSYSEALT